MELALIMPPKLLEYTNLLPGRFCIATVAMRDAVYREYFTKAKNVTLDNGVFEGEVTTPAALVELAKTIQPEVIICPDTIGGDAAKNFADALDFRTYAEGQGLKCEFMFVPQTKRGKWVEFEHAMQAAAERGFEWLGICRDAVYNAYGQFTNTKDQELNRFHFCAAILQDGLPQALNVKWHFLGVGERLDLLQYYWFVDRMDTASLFWQATWNHSVDTTGRLTTLIKRPKDYFTRDYPPAGHWYNDLKRNCTAALQYAQKATELRSDIQGGRL